MEYERYLEESAPRWQKQLKEKTQAAQKKVEAIHNLHYLSLHISVDLLVHAMQLYQCAKRLFVFQRMEEYLKSCLKNTGDQMTKSSADHPLLSQGLSWSSLT